MAHQVPRGDFHAGKGSSFLVKQELTLASADSSCGLFLANWIRGFAWHTVPHHLKSLPLTIKRNEPILKATDHYEAKNKHGIERSLHKQKDRNVPGEDLVNMQLFSKAPRCGAPIQEKMPPCSVIDQPAKVSSFAQSRKF